MAKKNDKECCKNNMHNPMDKVNTKNTTNSVNTEKSPKQHKDTTPTDCK